MRTRVPARDLLIRRQDWATACDAPRRAAVRALEERQGELADMRTKFQQRCDLLAEQGYARLAVISLNLALVWYVNS